MASIKFLGKTVEYNENALKSWKLQRKIAGGKPADMFDAIDVLLGGDADAVAEEFGDDINVMGQLVSAIIEQAGGDAKN